jgi:hypothetical protein
MRAVEHSDLLLTTAEVSIAFAGFASLVTLLGRRSAEQSLPLDVARLRGMILMSLLALAFSLFPFLPHMLGASPQAVWRISSVAFLLAGGSAGWMQLQYVRKVGMGRFGSVFVNGPLALLVLVLLVVNSVLDLGEFSPAIYVFGLFSLLFISGFLFLLTFLSFLGGSDS